jgi:transcription initiation factor TFIIB
MELVTQQVSCDVCDSSELVHDQVSGEIVCARCGIVKTDSILNKGPEWRAFTPSESAARERGSPTNLSSVNGGFFTSFRAMKDAKGATLAPEKLQKWKRLRRFDFRTKSDDNKMRNLNQAITEIERYSDLLHIPKYARDKAASIYRSALQRDLLRGRTISDFAAAAVYATCRQLRIPRSLSEVSKASGRSLRDVSRTYRLLVREFDLKMPVDDPMKFVPKLASNLKISLGSEKVTIEILQDAAERKMHVGKDPRSMSAAALYLACKSNHERVTQKRVADAAGVSTVSMRNRLRELEVFYCWD